MRHYALFWLNEPGEGVARHNMREEDSMLHSRVKETLRSRRGASITMALLLFLVCTVVGATVLTAGTASAGRVSDLARMDRRYYAVASAAELLAHELNGQEVVIEERTVGGSSSTTVNGKDANDSGLSYLTAQAAYYVKEADGGEEKQPLRQSLELTTDQGQTVYVTSVLEPNGTLTLTLRDSEEDTNAYQMIMTLLPAVSELGEWTETDDDETVAVSRSKISWSVESMR